MTHALRFELFATDLPFKRPFRHAAAERTSSSSLFLKCTTDEGCVGFGESLPRDYVSGESRDDAFELLQKDVLPRLLRERFSSFADVRHFLEVCDGQAPRAWLSDPARPSSAAWCAVDLALLDAFGRAFGEPVQLGARAEPPPRLRYSAVLSADDPGQQVRNLLKFRVYGLRALKLKVGGSDDLGTVQRARRWLGARADLRADANMAWDVATAEARMRELSRLGVSCVEQPLAADDLAGLARLVRSTGVGVMADESLTTRASLDALVAARACTAVNVRVAKCGGLVAAVRRAREALAAGLVLQVGCQVGESSLLSAAHLHVLAAARDVKWAEGCFGRHLLREDPVRPLLQFGYGGRPPRVPRDEPGLGVRVDEAALRSFASRVEVIE